MHVLQTSIPDVKVLKPSIFADKRGFFYESFNQNTFNRLCKQDTQFVQDNHSLSKQHVLRGIHYQIHSPQGKLIRVIHGKIYNVVVDLRVKSPTFMQWHGEVLDTTNRYQLWIPAGFGNSFLVTSATAEVVYKTTSYYKPEHERCIIWNDPQLNIQWPLKTGTPILSEKDQQGILLCDAELFTS